MESIPDHAHQLAAAERAAAAPYVDYPPTARWYPPAVGIWAAAMVAALTLLEDHSILQPLCLVALIAVECAAIASYRNHRRTMPSLRGAPAEINREMRVYFVVVALVMAAVAAAAIWLSGVVAVVVAFVLVTAGIHAYEGRYAKAAAATRARLG